MLGFHPDNSLVVLGINPDGRTVRFALRIDLPEQAAEAAHAAHHVTEMFNRNDTTGAVLVGYGTGEQVTPVIDQCRRSLTEQRITVNEALRVHEGRYWSYICGQPDCCPPEGMPFDITTTVTAAHATVSGQVVRADRDELARSVAPVTGSERAAVIRATRHAEHRLLRWGKEQGLAGVREGMIAEGLRMVCELRERIGHGLEPLPDDRAAWFGVLLANLRVRDEAWVRIGSEDLQAQTDFWQDLTRRVEPTYVPAPACLLAYTAFINGYGALANVALDRAQEADPGYSLAALLRELVTCGIAPDKVRLLMTPEALAAAYDEQQRPGGA